MTQNEAPLAAAGLITAKVQTMKINKEYQNLLFGWLLPYPTQTARLVII